MKHGIENNDQLINYVCLNMNEQEMETLENHLNECDECFEQSEGIRAYVKHKVLSNNKFENEAQLADFVKQEYAKMLNAIHQKFETKVSEHQEHKKVNKQDNIKPIAVEPTTKSNSNNSGRIVNLRQTFVALSMVAVLALLITLAIPGLNSTSSFIIQEDLPDKMLITKSSRDGQSDLAYGFDNYNAKNWKESVNALQSSDELKASYYLGLIQLQKKQKHLKPAEFYFKKYWKNTSSEEDYNVIAAYYLAKLLFKKKDYQKSLEFANYVATNKQEIENLEIEELIEKLQKKLK